MLESDTLYQFMFLIVVFNPSELLIEVAFLKIVNNSFVRIVFAKDSFFIKQSVI